MKKKYLLFLSICLFLPSLVKATTLGEYENKVAKYESEMRANQNKININDETKRATLSKIEKIKKESIDLRNEAAEIEIKIAEDSKKIKAKDEESKKIVAYFQLSKSANLYLDYIFNAKDTSDLTYRASVTEQLLDFNEKTVKELNKLIKEREHRQKEIEIIEVELAKKNEEAQKLLVILGEEKHALEEGALSINDQLKQYKQLVETYKKLGCKTNDRIGIDCAKESYAGIFRRPMRKGYVTSEFSKRAPIFGTSSFHNGLDMSSDNKYEPVYSIANGRVTHVYRDHCYGPNGGGNTVVVYYNSNGKMYSGIYIHLRSFGPKIKAGNYITSEDLIGIMGSTGCSTGPHLHLTIVPCRFLDPTDYKCSTYTRMNNYALQLYNQGYKGPRQFFPVPRGLYNYWYGR